MSGWTETSPGELVSAHLNRIRNTARAYRQDLQAFAAFVGAATVEQAVEGFVGSGRGAARRQLENFKNHLRREGFSLSTTRRRVSSLLGLLAMANEFGVIPWSIRRFPLPAPRPVRDTRGPDRDGVERMMSACHQRGDAKGRRDMAMLCLLFYNALRSHELLSLDVAHVDLERREAWIATKGGWSDRDRACIPIPLRTGQAVEDWIESRGDAPGPLFVSLHRNRVGGLIRLTYRGLHHVVGKLGEEAGVKCRPHGLRHAAASEMDRLTNGNVGWGMAITRHRDANTLMVYNDARSRAMRQAAEILVRGAYIRQGPEEG